jgi:hypothetical protein
MPTADHDLLTRLDTRSCNDHDWIEKAEPRLRKIEDALLQARTAVVLAKAICGLVSADILVQIALANHFHF